VEIVVKSEQEGAWIEEAVVYLHLLSWVSLVRTIQWPKFLGQNWEMK